MCVVVTVLTVKLYISSTAEHSFQQNECQNRNKIDLFLCQSNHLHETILSLKADVLMSLPWD